MAALCASTLKAMKSMYTSKPAHRSPTSPSRPTWCGVVSTGNEFSTIYKINSKTNELEDIGDFGIWDGGIKIAASENNLWLINFTMGNTLILLDGRTGEKLEEIDLAAHLWQGH